MSYARQDSKKYLVAVIFCIYGGWSTVNLNFQPPCPRLFYLDFSNRPSCWDLPLIQDLKVMENLAFMCTKMLACSQLPDMYYCCCPMTFITTTYITTAGKSLVFSENYQIHDHLGQQYCHKCCTNCLQWRDDVLCPFCRQLVQHLWQYCCITARTNHSEDSVVHEGHRRPFMLSVGCLLGRNWKNIYGDCNR